MKIEYRQYECAPDSLEIFLNGVLLKKSYYSKLGYDFYKSKNKIKFIREHIVGQKDISSKKWVKISFLHSVERYKSFDKTYYGTVLSYEDILKFKATMAKKHCFSDIIKINFVKRNLQK